MNKKLIILLAIIVAIILFGISLGVFYSLLPGHNPPNREACENVGGQWSDEKKLCLLSYKESGEVCIDGGQCQSGVCFPPTLTEEQKNDLTNGPLKNIVGTCYPDELITGCVEQVIMGTVSKELMCLD